MISKKICAGNDPESGDEQLPIPLQPVRQPVLDAHALPHMPQALSQVQPHVQMPGQPNLVPQLRQLQPSNSSEANHVPSNDAVTGAQQVVLAAAAAPSGFQFVGTVWGHAGEASKRRVGGGECRPTPPRAGSHGLAAAGSCSCTAHRHAGIHGGGIGAPGGTAPPAGHACALLPVSSASRVSNQNSGPLQSSFGSPAQQHAARGQHVSASPACTDACRGKMTNGSPTQALGSPHLAHSQYAHQDHDFLQTHSQSPRQEHRQVSSAQHVGRSHRSSAACCPARPKLDHAERAATSQLRISRDQWPTRGERSHRVQQAVPPFPCAGSGGNQLHSLPERQPDAQHDSHVHAQYLSPASGPAELPGHEQIWQHKQKLQQHMASQQQPHPVPFSRSWPHPQPERPRQEQHRHQRFLQPLPPAGQPRPSTVPHPQRSAQCPGMQPEQPTGEVHVRGVVLCSGSMRRPGITQHKTEGEAGGLLRSDVRHLPGTNRPFQPPARYLQ
jgi:hypothetical protein